MSYHNQLIEVNIFDEDLYNRICTVAEEKGETIESIIRLITMTGLGCHMDRNLKFIYEERNQQND